MPLNYKESGNLKYTVNQLTEAEIDKVAITSFTRTEERLSIFNKIIDLGKKCQVKHKPVYLVLYKNKIYYAFIGTEADILRDFGNPPAKKDEEENTDTTDQDIETALDEIYSTGI